LRAAQSAPSTQAGHNQEERMQLGMIGLGRMGANMARRLMRGGHQCLVYDRSPDTVKALAAEGARGCDSL
jgi:6-phosphogluconate dehydrogenase